MNRIYGIIHGMDIGKLSKWKNSLESEIQTIRDNIQSLNSKLQQKNQQLELICRLIDTESSCSTLQAEGVSTSNHNLPMSPAVLPSKIKEHVYQILSEARRPMNIKEIHAEFIRRGYPIPGKGTHFNILVHIGRELKRGRASRFRRDGRGTYSLRPNQVEKEKK